MLRLAKEDFKFAAAHFTLFPDGSGELLHGHNFRVAVELVGRTPDALGLLVDVAKVKERIRAICDGLDEHTLIPEKTAMLSLQEEGDEIEILFGARRYRLPRGDVSLLPLSNVTIELLAKHVWDALRPSLEGAGLDELRVSVEETAGQSCAFEGPIAP